MRRLSSIRWKAIERSRRPYYKLAEKEFNKALLAQLRPVIEYVELHGRIEEEILKQLIHETPLKDSFDFVYTQAGVDFAQRQYNKFVTGEDLKKQFEVYLKDWVNKYAGDKITSITGVTRKDARKIINGVMSENLGMAEGEMGRAMVRALKDEGGKLAQWRARMISRTEVSTASNVGQQIGAEAVGIDMQKIWLSTMDDRVRDAHYNLNGAAADINGYFLVDGDRMYTPGDPNGSAANVVNCRCALQYKPYPKMSERKL